MLSYTRLPFLLFAELRNNPIHGSKTKKNEIMSIVIRYTPIIWFKNSDEQKCG